MHLLRKEMRLNAVHKWRTRLNSRYTGCGDGASLEAPQTATDFLLPDDDIRIFTTQTRTDPGLKCTGREPTEHNRRR